jgi:hypothetical protein
MARIADGRANGGFMEWARMLGFITGTVDQELLLVRCESQQTSRSAASDIGPKDNVAPRGLARLVISDRPLPALRAGLRKRASDGRCGHGPAGRNLRMWFWSTTLTHLQALASPPEPFS